MSTFLCYLCFALWAVNTIAITITNTTNTTNTDAGDQSSVGPAKGYKFGIPGKKASFDYVIVGGGTAGLALAARLAVNPSLSVAVVEAGGFYEADVGNISVVPAYAVMFTGTSPSNINPLIDWGFVTTPQSGAADRKLHYARGKTLGGSSARNFLFYHRPTIGSLDLWADQVGDQSYSYRNFLPYFEKSVHYTPPSIQYKNSSNVQLSNEFVASGGPLQVSFGKYEDPWGTWAQKAFQAIGQTAIKGFQNGRLIGSAYMPFTEDPITAHRSSSESSFLQSEKNFITLYNNTLAKKIIFQGRNIRATGVKVTPYTTDGTESLTYTLCANKEVILCAGAFQSPQLLMVSGIGPRSTLSQFKIPVLHHLPGVGQDLQDQPVFGSTHRVGVNTVSASINHPALKAAAILAYNTEATGPLTNAVTPVRGFENLPPQTIAAFSLATRNALAAYPSDWPQLEFLPVGEFVANGSNFANADPHDGYNYATIATTLLTTASRGSVTIASPDTSDLPIINPNWLTTPEDAEVAVAAFKRQRLAWSRISNITIGPEYYPGSKVTTDSQILSFIRENLSTPWRAACTCKMGKKDDKSAVVDSKMRVFGTQGLRVVDASAFPFLPPGHPQSTVYALAEKAAVDILRGL